MKSPISSPAFLLLALTGLAVADVPKKAPLGKYSSLYTNSPFTSKPVIEPGQENNPLDDYSLLGVSPIGGTGYRVTLINKKKPEERITVDSDSTKSGFKILSVIRKPGDPQGTVVRMSSGPMTGTVSFDQKLLTIAAPSPKAQPPQPGQPPQLSQQGRPTQPGQQPQPLQGGQPQRQPRPRVVPPPTPPTANGQAQPVQPPQSNAQRPARRSN
jgi:hypothetical protein